MSTPLVPAEERSSHTLDVSVGHGRAASYTGLRTVVRAVTEAGADLSGIAERHPAEWSVLVPEAPAVGPGISEVALAPSERRLHRESEQVFRVLNVAAAAVCRASAQLGRTVVVRHAGATDLTSLRGLMRVHEYARTVSAARVEFADADVFVAAEGPDEDYRRERALCLARMGIDASAGDLRPSAPSAAETVSREQRLYEHALSPEAGAEDRLVAALAYSRSAFFSCNWEGMAAVARAVLPLTRGLPDGRVDGMLDAARTGDQQSEAIEFEPTTLTSAADLGAFLHKVLGIQASYRGAQDDAVAHFLRMREVPGNPSPEMRAQSHLYVALVNTKRLGRLDDAVAELESGLESLEALTGTRDSVRREQGWLNNLRALVYFRQKRFRSAFDAEKRALDCIAGLNDASSVHLRINLLSNLSVLQEKAGRVGNAIQTWNRFRSASGSDNTSFLKHHAYRAAGLSLLEGDTGTGLRELDTSLRGALAQDDDFHEYEIRMELGGLDVRRGDTETAREHFKCSETAARRVGDPLRIALALAAQATAEGTAPPPEATGALSASTTYPARAKALAESFRAGPEAVADALPVPRTKLNRPFDTVNFQG